MSKMAPSAAELKEALVQGTRQVFEADPEGISVNKVRKHVEEKLELEDGFFAEGKWKSTSKTLIKELVSELLAAADDAEEEEPETKAGTNKRQSPKAESPQAKRQKRTSGAPNNKKLVARNKKNDKNDKDKVADLDEAEDMEESTMKRKKKPSASKKKVDAVAIDASEGSEQETKPKSKKSAARRKAQPVADSDEEEPESDSSQTKPEPAKQRERDADDKSESEGGDSGSGGRLSKNGKVDVSKEDGDDEDTTMDSPEETTGGDSIFLAVGGGPRSISHATEETEVMEEDEYSDVIDEPPSAKSKKKGKGSKETSSKPKASKPAVPKKKAAPAPDDSQEAEVKKLQSQLAKCGIRKFWANELKQYGGDARAKIRHLKKMLADIGMEGRFSEAKAREIKETRELLADVEAAQEMNKLWGMSSNERASRSKSKGSKPAAVQKTKMDSESEEEEVRDQGDEKDEEDEADEDEEPTSFAARRRKAHADLAFLGDDSDSE